MIRTASIRRMTFGLCLVIVVFSGCQESHQNQSIPGEVSKSGLPERPNILWLVAEDLGPYIAPFGDTTASTPNLSRLAHEGMIYPHTYSPSGVCAPSRAAIATGMYPTSIGAGHMRTSSNMETTGLPAYEAVPGPQVKMVSELLRINGYYCTNNEKEDYQFRAPATAWDESGPYAHWRNRSENQPFFAVFNFTQTHESGLFEPYGFKNREQRHYQSGDREIRISKGQMKEVETPVHLSKETAFTIPPYLPDTQTARRDIWKMYNNIIEMDQQIGAVLDQLQADGLLEDTIIFFYGDHGGPLPRQKRLIYDSGLNTPLIIRFPNKKWAGTRDDQLISFVDFAPTLLSLAGVRPLDVMQGQAFLGKFKSQTERKHIYAAADRFDEVTDAIRAVRDKRYKYIRNYRPEQGYYLPLEYRERIPTMRELLDLRNAKALDSTQSLWFREKKDEEELFDCQIDPHELNNLALDPAYAEKLAELRTEMDRWLGAIEDQPNLPEKELLKELWNGSTEKPVTAAPAVQVLDGKVSVTCATKGASIGYLFLDESLSPQPWKVYSTPFAAQTGSTLKIQAHRIGFEPSEIVEIDMGN